MAAITAALVKELRDRTSAPMMKCKKFLTEANGDIDEAVTLMRKADPAAADKRAGKITAEGAVVVAMSDDHQTAFIAEVNSETDFVARDESFKAFAQMVADAGLANAALSVEDLMAVSVDAQTIDEVRQTLISKLGENLQVRRVAFVRDSGYLAQYRHGDSIGVVVGINKEDDELARDLAMHVAATNPRVVRAEDMPEEAVTNERDIFIAQAKASGKPDDIIEKMITGRIKKFLNENCLLGQAFVKDPNQTVGDLVSSKEAEVAQFVRFEVGEGIEKEEQDFASEVMAQVNNS